jgi:hypothetical protein
MASPIQLGDRIRRRLIFFGFIVLSAIIFIEPSSTGTD